MPRKRGAQRGNDNAKKSKLKVAREVRRAQIGQAHAGAKFKGQKPAGMSGALLFGLRGIKGKGSLTKDLIKADLNFIRSMLK